MIKKIMCLSRSDTARIKRAIVENNFISQIGYDNIFCISINGTQDLEGIEAAPLFTFQEMLDARCHVNVRRIVNFAFDDIEPDTTCRTHSARNAKPMSLTQATCLINILNSWNKLPSNDLLIVHCQAGICRSGSVVRFAGWLFNKEEQVLKDNPHIQRNNWVSSMLYYVYKEKYGRSDT